jgi:hypothetical protein
MKEKHKRQVSAVIGKRLEREKRQAYPGSILITF